MTVTLHQGDLPDGLDLGDTVAIDSETMGLRPHRDRLCLVQLSAGDGNVHLVQFKASQYEAPNLRRLLADPQVVKLFHFARFDVAVMAHYLGVHTAPIWCTKIASKLVRTYTDRHGLKDLCKELLDIDLSKQQQSSDWGGPELNDAQRDYAASDVRFLHALMEKFEERLAAFAPEHLVEAALEFMQIDHVLGGILLLRIRQHGRAPVGTLLLLR